MDGIQQSLTGAPTSAWERVVHFDLRSLALFRVALGILLVADAWMRWPDLEALYSDRGYFTRDMVNQYFTSVSGSDWRLGTWSLHLANGSAEWQHVLFGAQAVCGVLLALGLLSRVAVIAGWVLVCSAQLRAPLVITAGDFILKMMLFWSLFLPLNRFASLDRYLFRRPATAGDPASPPTWFASWGTAGYLIQLVILYFCTGQAKWNEIWWSGDAMYYVLHLDIYCRPFGRQLLEYPWLLKLVSWGTLLIELVLIWLLLCPWRNTLWRWINMGAYWAFHLGILVSMSIGLFPWICLVLWLPLVPASFWNGLGAKLTARPLLPVGAEGLRGGLGKAGEAFCATMAGMVVLWNVINFEFIALAAERIPFPIRWLARVTAIDQRFQMFGVPPKLNPWFVYEARLKDQSKVDLMRPGHTLSFEMPPSVLQTIPTHNWRQLHRNLTNDHFRAYRGALLDYWVRHWNETHPPERQVIQARLHCYQHETGPDFESRPITSTIWKSWTAPNSSAGSLFDDFSDRIQNSQQVPY